MQKLLFTVAVEYRRKLSRYSLLFVLGWAAVLALPGPSSCQASEPPLSIQIQAQGQNIILLGPDWATNALVQGSSNLATGSWTTVAESFDPTNGLVLTNYGETVRFFRLHIPVEPPRVLAGPASATRAVGEGVTFGVTAAGTAPLTYQWLFNASNAIAGATESSLVLTNLQMTNAGNYSVVVSNAFGFTNSQPATLTVYANTAPPGMALIPAGAFDMGDTFNEGLDDERPVHTVYISSFYLDTNLVSKTFWDAVYTWALTNGYSFENAGLSKGTNHPVETLNWYDVVKWCNARSEKEGLTPAYYTSAAQTDVYRTGRVDLAETYVLWTGNGYRLPTEAEWEKAARAGATGLRFPWGDTITHSDANYLSNTEYPYDVSPTRGTHPLYSVGPEPFTSPAGSFAPNAYGLFDMGGNIYEWCWDWAQYGWYNEPNAVLPDTRGPATGAARVIRGGGWNYNADRVRCARRGNDVPAVANIWESFGLRCARGL